MGFGILPCSGATTNRCLSHSYISIIRRDLCVPFIGIIT